MSAYIIAYVDVSDAEQYEMYKKLSTHAMQVHQAEFCCRGGQVEVLEGDWAPERVVVMKFKDMQAARSYYESAEYMQARDARASAAHVRMIIVDGVC